MKFVDHQKICRSSYPVSVNEKCGIVLSLIYINVGTVL